MRIKAEEQRAGPEDDAVRRNHLLISIPGMHVNGGGENATKLSSDCHEHALAYACRAHACTHAYTPTPYTHSTEVWARVMVQ